MTAFDTCCTQLVALGRWLLLASASATALAALIFALQLALGRWLTPGWRYRLWGLVVLRLMVPALPAGPAGIVNPDWVALGRHVWTLVTRQAPVRLPPSGAPAAKSKITVVVTFDPPPMKSWPTASGDVAPNAVAAEPLPVYHRPPTWETALAGLWLGVGGLLLVRLITVNVSLRRRLRGAAPITDASVLRILEECRRALGVRRSTPMLVTSAVRVPAAAGVWRPCILLPPGLIERLTPEELRVILTHELAHIRCHDVAVNWVMALVQIVNWFNPIVRLAFWRLRADREIARDAMVLAAISPSTSQLTPTRYARLLLQLTQSLLAPPYNTAAITGIAGIVEMPGFFTGRSGLHRRLKMIMRLPPLPPRRSIIGPLLALVLAGAAFTRAQSPSPATRPEPPAVPGATPRPALSVNEREPLPSKVSNVVTQVYDVRDLLADVPNFGPGAAPPTTLPADEAIKQLVKLVEETVASDTWKDRGGAVGAVRELQGQLVVIQTPDNQAAIAQLLEQLHEGRALQVTVEARFISCAEPLYRTLVADWEKARVTTTQPALKVEPPATQPPAAGAAFFLDDDQVSKFLNATQESPESEFICAPRITCFSGQRAYVLISTEHAYVRNYTTEVAADGKTRYEPVYATAAPGIVMDVQATASADRKYATLTLRPRVSVLVAMNHVAWPSRPAGSTLVVDEPRLKTSELQTTLNVPNGGTVVLGGMEDPGIGDGLDDKQPDHAADRRLSIEDYAKIDVRMADMLKARAAERMNYASLRGTLGQSNPSVIRAKAVIDASNSEMQAYCDQLNEKNAASTKAEAAATQPAKVRRYLFLLVKPTLIVEKPHPTPATKPSR